MIDDNNLAQSLLVNKEAFRKTMETNARFQELMMMYRCAIREIQTKLEILNDEFKTKNQRNPIDSIRTRVKSPASIFDKMQRKGFEVSIQSIVNNLNDVAGVRVVCPFISDIYAVANMLISQDDVEVMEVKDYIKNPKPNGYRSLHYVVIIPIYLSSGKEYMKVEGQIRTIAMNFWASLEHKIYYKFEGDAPDYISRDLRECAEMVSTLDEKMLSLNEAIKECLEKQEELNISTKTKETNRQDQRVLQGLD